MARNRTEIIGKEALMESNNTNSPGPKRDAAALELLRKLREKMFSRDISSARLAAHNLSWMQDDGLAILKEALFGDYPGPAKKAAAYGLRSMKGRMKKLALEVIEQGLNHRDRVTRQVCAKCLFLANGGTPPPTHNRRGPSHGNRVIRDIPNKRHDVAPRSADHP